MATKCILIQNMTPDSRINNELTLKSVLKKKSIPFKKITCPPDTGNRHRQPHHLQLSSHAFIEFDSDEGISKFATFLNGYSLGFAILRANIRPAQGTTSDETKPPSWWDEEEAWHDALAVKNNKTHKDVPVGEWPKLETTSSSSSIASSANSTDKIKPVPRATYNATREEYCAYCVRNTHSTENCKVLHYHWKTQNFQCNYCINIPGCVDIVHPIKYKGILVCPTLIEKAKKEKEIMNSHWTL